MRRSEVLYECGAQRAAQAQAQHSAPMPHGNAAAPRAHQARLSLSLSLMASSGHALALAVTASLAVVYLVFCRAVGRLLLSQRWITRKLMHIGEGCGILFELHAQMGLPNRRLRRRPPPFTRRLSCVLCRHRPALLTLLAPFYVLCFQPLDMRCSAGHGRTAICDGRWRRDARRRLGRQLTRE